MVVHNGAQDYGLKLRSDVGSAVAFMCVENVGKYK